ncbi:hypothetical protein [Enterococcus hirae]|uniref:hypothetical protein n=1 Tax=Enterococcus hirae TaxID=1354 RepID=UPI001956C56C|nr:hypothetical protein [Enterococcus hirae]
MIEVKIEESNAVRIRKERYSYVEFEQLSEELRPENSVTYLLVQDKKVLYQGKYQTLVDKKECLQESIRKIYLFLKKSKEEGLLQMNMRDMR